MFKTAIALFFVLVFSGSVFGQGNQQNQDSPQMPDFRNKDAGWILVEKPPGADDNAYANILDPNAGINRLITIGKLEVYANEKEHKAVVLVVGANKDGSRIEPFAMYLYMVRETEVFVEVINIDGQWYVGAGPLPDYVTKSDNPIFDQNGEVLSVDLSLETTDGLKKLTLNLDK